MRVYFDPSGFGSIATTLKDAKQYDKPITYEDVTKWKYSQDVWQKEQMRGMHSFIADAPREEYQMDLFVLSDQPVAPQRKNALLMVDIISKYTQVVPCRSEQTSDVLNAIQECLDNIFGKHKNNLW